MTSASDWEREYMLASLDDAPKAVEFMERLFVARPGDLERLAFSYEPELKARLGEVLSVMRRYFPGKRSPNIPRIRQEADGERGNSS